MMMTRIHGWVVRTEREGGREKGTASEREKAKNINNKNNTYNTRRIGGGGGGGEYRKEGKVKKLRVSFPTAGWVDDSDDDDDDR